MHSTTQHNAAVTVANPASEGGSIRMAELVRRTGVPKTTILFYLREGLLAPPQRPFPNQARYGPEHVERLLLIKELQTAYHFPLAKIRRLVDMVGRGASVEAVRQMHERLVESRPTATSPRRWTFAEFCDDTGLEPDVVERALDAQLLNPLNQSPEREFDSADVEVGRVLAAGRRLGMQLDDLHFLVGHARAIAEGEMALRQRLVEGRPLEEDIALTTELTDMARALHTYIVDRMFISMAMRQRVGDSAAG